jgi:hypothetical protein
MNLQRFPVALGMVYLAQRSNQDTSSKYMCLWSAFNNIYQYMGDKYGLGSVLQRDNPYPKPRELDGYFLPHVKTKSEQTLILDAVQKLSEDQKSDFLNLSLVDFFVRRISEGARGNFNETGENMFASKGQRINGELNRTRTVDPWFTSYAPIDSRNMNPSLKETEQTLIY